MRAQRARAARSGGLTVRPEGDRVGTAREGVRCRRTAWAHALGLGVLALSWLAFGAVAPAAADQATDAALVDEIQKQLARDSYTEAYEITVDVEGGIADLRGTVETEAESERAEKIAGDVDGVSKVHNGLLVRSAPIERIPPVAPPQGPGRVTP